MAPIFAKKPRRPWLKPLLGLGFALSACAGSGAWLFFSLGRWFQSSDEPAKADLMVVLCGDPSRSIRAAELFKQGFAPEVWVGRPIRDPWLAKLDKIGIVLAKEEELHKQVLVARGVPPHRVHFFGEHNLSTTEEAIELSKALRGRAVSKVMIVSGRTHCRRARMIFARNLRGISVEAVSADAGPPNPVWWRDKFLAQDVVMEGIRTLFYVLGGSFNSRPKS